MFRRILVVLGLVTGLSAQQTQLWETPSPGWLYVLDRGGTDGDTVLLIDTEGIGHGRLALTDETAFSLTNDGTALAILQGDKLIVLDVHEGTVIHETTVANRVRGRAEIGFPYLFSSPSLIFVQTQLKPSEDTCLTIVSAFDPVAGQFTGMRTGLPDCLPWLMMPAGVGNSLIFVAPFRNAIQFTDWQNDLGQSSVWLPRESPTGQPLPDGRNSGAVLLEDATRMIIVKEDSSLLSLDLPGRRILASVSQPVPNVYVYPFSTLATDSTILVPASDASDGTREQLPDRVLVFSATTLQYEGSILTSQRFVSMTLDRGILYLPTGEGGDILIVDLDSRREVQSIDDVGAAPIHVLVAR